MSGSGKEGDVVAIKTQDSLEFYEGYFTGVDHAEQQFDVGTWATRFLLKQHLGKTPRIHVDIGCGDGHALRDVHAPLRVGIDYSWNTLHQCREVAPAGTLLVQASATALPFKTGSLDGISSAHVIEHLEHDEWMMKEIERALRPQGRFVVITPGRANGIPDDAERVMNGHFRRYNMTRVQWLMQTVPGLQLERQICAHRLLGGIWNRLKWVFRGVNLPLKRWIFCDNRSVFQRRFYQKCLLPLFFWPLEIADRLFRARERYFWESDRNSFLMVWSGSRKTHEP